MFLHQSHALIEVNVVRFGHIDRGRARARKTEKGRAQLFFTAVRCDRTVELDMNR